MCFKCFGEGLDVLSRVSLNYLITYGCYAFIQTSPDAILRYDACARVGLMCGGGGEGEVTLQYDRGFYKTRQRYWSIESLTCKLFLYTAIHI
jgi:hypothetical protein